MAIKVKEMSETAIVSIKVNRSFYYMTKGLSFYLFMLIDVPDKEAYLKDTLTKAYEDLDDLQKSFYTVALLLGEIEKETVAQGHFIEKDMLQPGDVGYVIPT